MMRLPWKTKTEAAPETVEPISSAPRTERWTKGAALRVSALRWGFWSWFLIGPVVIGLAISATSAGGQAPQTEPVTQVRPVTDQSAGTLAAGLVSAWFSSTQRNTAAIEAFGLPASSVVNSQPVEFRNLTISSVSAPADGMISVQIGAEIKQTSTGADGKAVDTWPLRYFAVSVQSDGNQLGVISVPAPIAGPETVPNALVNAYGSRVATTDPAGQSVAAFLSAYLSGQGDITRYVKPGVTLSAITPAPYTAVKVIDISSDREIPSKPADGSIVKVAANAYAMSGENPLAVRYTLTLTARADRWEISALDLIPATVKSTNQAMPTTSKGTAP